MIFEKALCPDGRRRNAYPTWPTDGPEHPAVIRYRRHSIAGTVTEGRDGWRFEPKATGRNRHLLIKPRIDQQPGPKGQRSGRSAGLDAISCAVSNGWDFDAEGIDPADFDTGSARFDLAVHYATEYLNRKCRPEGYSYGVQTGVFGLWPA